MSWHNGKKKVIPLQRNTLTLLFAEYQVRKEINWLYKQYVLFWCILHSLYRLREESRHETSKKLEREVSMNSSTNENSSQWLKPPCA